MRRILLVRIFDYAFAVTASAVEIAPSASIPSISMRIDGDRSREPADNVAVDIITAGVRGKRSYINADPPRPGQRVAGHRRALKGGEYSNIPLPLPIWIVLLVTLAKESATYTPVADPVAVMALPEATVAWPTNIRQLLPFVMFAAYSPKPTAVS